MNNAPSYANTALSLRTDGSLRAMHLSRALRTLNTSLPDEITAGPPYGIDGLLSKSLVSGLPQRDYLQEAADIIEEGGNPDEILALHAGYLLRAAAAQKVGQSRTRDYLANLDVNADHIIRTLRAEVFEPLIIRITEAVEAYGTNLSAADAIKAKDWDRAKMLDGIAEGFSKMHLIHQVRNHLHHEAFTGSAAWAIEPGAVEGDPSYGAHGVQRRNDDPHWWAQLISAGNTPHFPTLGELNSLRKSPEHLEWEEAQNAGTFAAGLKTGDRRASSSADFS